MNLDVKRSSFWCSKCHLFKETFLITPTPITLYPLLCFIIFFLIMQDQHGYWLMGLRVRFVNYFSMFLNSPRQNFLKYIYNTYQSCTSSLMHLIKVSNSRSNSYCNFQAVMSTNEIYNCNVKYENTTGLVLMEKSQVHTTAFFFEREREIKGNISVREKHQLAALHTCRTGDQT